MLVNFNDLIEAAASTAPASLHSAHFPHSAAFTVSLHSRCTTEMLRREPFERGFVAFIDPSAIPSREGPNYRFLRNVVSLKTPLVWRHAAFLS